MKRTILTLALTLVAIFSNAQTPDLEQKGDSTKWIRQIISDGNNGLWIATEGGLVNYDKSTGATTLYTAENAGLPSNNICSIFIDDEDLWLGTKFNGVAKMKGGHLIATYDHTNSGLETDQYFCSIARHGEQLVFGSLLGINIFDGEDFHYIKTPDGELSAFIGFNAIAEDSHGRLWVGGCDALGRESLCYLNDDQELVPVSAPHYITGMIFDENDVLWMATQKDGLAKLDGQSTTKYTPENSQMASSHSYCISHDTDGNIWICTGKCLVCYDGISFNVTEIPLAENDWIFTFLIDGDKKWIGTRHSGLYLLENGLLTHHSFDEQSDESDFVLPEVYPVKYHIETTGISAINTDSRKKTGICNLQGQKLSTIPGQGIFIKDGKKIFMK